jgi:hypothetical protein
MKSWSTNGVRLNSPLARTTQQFSELMDASHLILGRTWQFDNHAVFDGRRHLYSVQTGEKKVHILSMQEFEHDLEKSGMCLIITSTTFTQPEQEEKYSRLVVSILATYRDVLGELSDGLPPLWDIQHQIDPFEQSSLLNVPRSARRAPKTSARAPRQRLYAREHKPMCRVCIAHTKEGWDVLNVCR